MSSTRLAMRRVAAVLVAAAWFVIIGNAVAEEFPTRPIRIVSFVPSGSAADALLRAMALEASTSLNASFIVDNRPGGSGAVAVQAVRTSSPDGYTLLLGGSSVMLSSILRNAAVNPFADLTPLAEVISTPTALGVRSDLGLRTVEDMVKMANASPGKFSYATVGVGSYAHVMMELLSRRAGIQLLHAPYPQLGTGITDMVGGRIDGVFSLLGTMQPQAKAGLVRFLAITGDRRTPVSPDVPTFVEAGFPDLGVNAWNGLFAPSGTPPAVMEKLANSFAQAAQSPKVQELARTTALEATGTTPTAFNASLQRELVYWRKVIAETGIKVD